MSDSVNFEVLEIHSVRTSDCESLFIKLDNLTYEHLTVVGVIYRHPKNDLAHFTDELSKFLNRI